MSEPSSPTDTLPGEIGPLVVDPGRPLLVVDVDEALAMFMRGFEAFVGRRGLEMRITAFAIFQNIYRPGDSEHLDVAAGRQLLEDFFRTDVEAVDVAAGAREAIAGLARSASVVVLTNAPETSRLPRTRWLRKSGFPYTLVINAGLKGPPMAALAAKTRGPVAFVDDLLPNLDSVAASAPRVRRFQMVADERLRALAFSAPERHLRIDDWPRLAVAITEAFAIESTL